MNSPSERNPPPAGTPVGGGIMRRLQAFTEGDPDQLLSLDTLLTGLRRSAFGMFLFVSILPGFVPIPGVGGAVGGPLVILIGLQLLVGLARPWLPRFIGRRGPRRRTLVRFGDRIAPWLARLEHLVRPRLPLLVGNRLANAFTGLLLVVLGILLALPLPMTNYLFAGVLLFYALALIERDGALLLVLWVATLGGLLAMGLLSESLAELLAQAWQRLWPA
ncbi:exopolysaccharide biosynthesis protein [Pseudoxanthomonas koreensis]|uniref:exopolysaccharide biosynthesis protein n=1 Tax=Pseudoxanthomonas koreensis TaxID=266061 RepID=UPI0035A58E76